jgi:hypothetical protein
VPLRTADPGELLVLDGSPTVQQAVQS